MTQAKTIGTFKDDLCALQETQAKAKKRRTAVLLRLQKVFDVPLDDQLQQVGADLNGGSGNKRDSG